MNIIKLTLTVKGSIIVGGQTSPVLVDIATARDPAGIPLIPASAVKGALRIEFERLARLKYPRKICDAGAQEGACGPPADACCIVCSVFGSPGLEGKLRFYDARLREDLWHIFSKRGERDGKNMRMATGFGYTVRPGVAISRKRKVATEKMLFASETIAQFIPQCAFEAQVESLKELTEEERSLLELAVRNLEAIGADKSRGLGHMEVTLQELVAAENSSPRRILTGDLKLTLIPQEYVRVSSVKALDNFMDSFEFIPGSSVRGAMARSFASSRGDNWKDETVRQDFLRSPVLFSEFYPTMGRAPTRPIPLSARTCKIYPGLTFISADKGKESHGTKDILISATIVKKLREFGLPAMMGDKCKHCLKPLKEIGGFYMSRSPRDPKLDLSYRMNTKTAINRRRMTSSEGQLYSYKLMDTKLELEEKDRIEFIGTVTELTDELRQHIISLDGQSLLIGGARYRGFGKMKVRVERTDEDHDEKKDMWQQRMESFTLAVKSPLLAAGIDEVKDSLFFSFTLLSDLILSIGDREKQLVMRVGDNLKISDRGLRLEKIITRVSYRGGYSDALGIRKDLLPVVCRGSAFVFSCESDAQELILDNLPDLLIRGIGARREEGFGRLSFCDNFHLNRREQS